MPTGSILTVLNANERVTTGAAKLLAFNKQNAVLLIREAIES